VGGKVSNIIHDVRHEEIILVMEDFSPLNFEKEVSLRKVKDVLSALGWEEVEPSVRYYLTEVEVSKDE